MMVVSMTAAIRVAVEVSTYFFYVFSDICGSGIGGSYIGWVVMVVVVMVRYWWSSEGDDGYVDCCNGGSCY